MKYKKVRISFYKVLKEIHEETLISQYQFLYVKTDLFMLNYMICCYRKVLIAYDIK